MNNTAFSLYENMRVLYWAEKGAGGPRHKHPCHFVNNTVQKIEIEQKFQ